MIAKEKILAYALENALLHGGKARIDAVLAKLFREGLKKEELNKVMPLITKTVSEINKIPRAEQERKFSLLKELIAPKAKPREGLPELPHAKGKVVLRFAPFPSGALHIGNARAALLNDEYAKKYHGKLLLVIDDTIGSEEKIIVPEAYKLILEGLDWLRVKYAKPVIYKSKRLELYYKYASELIKKGKAYVCFCSAEKLRANRATGKECECRAADIDKNLLHWGYMLSKKAKPGSATLRIKTSMQHPNPAFRDRVLFRISDRKHPKTGSKYRCWPMLEFSWAIDDHLLGITHIIRGKELMIESEMEKLIWDIFGWKHPVLIHTGSLSLEGVKISKTKSREEVESGTYRGWDDPRTWSLQSLAKRGIHPEALRKFCLSFGLTQTEVTAPIDMLYSENKKFVETANRYFFVDSPVKIQIQNAPKLQAALELHPDHPERGARKFLTKGEFYLAKEDFDKISHGEVYRLMHLLNFVKQNTALKFHSAEHKKELNAKLLHWLPAHKEEEKKLVKAKVLMPDGTFVEGLAEPEIKKVKVGTVVQFERFGFCRLNAKKKNQLEFWFGHR
jgi:glutamyl-tRNA synthetase